MAGADGIHVGTAFEMGYMRAQGKPVFGIWAGIVSETGTDSAQKP